MLSLFLFFAPPPREEAKRRKGNPELISLLRPGIRSGYTRIWRRQPERGGCAHRTNVATLVYAARAKLLLSATFFHPILRGE